MREALVQNLLTRGGDRLLATGDAVDFPTFATVEVVEDARVVPQEVDAALVGEPEKKI